MRPMQLKMSIASTSRPNTSKRNKQGSAIRYLETSHRALTFCRTMHWIPQSDIGDRRPFQTPRSASQKRCASSFFPQKLGKLSAIYFALISGRLLVNSSTSQILEDRLLTAWFIPQMISLKAEYHHWNHIHHERSRSSPPHLARMGYLECSPNTNLTRTPPGRF